MQAYFADICISITRLTKNIKVLTSQISLEKTRVKRKTVKLVCVASTLSTQHERERAKKWLARYQDNVSEWDNNLSAYCCFSELAL